MPKITRLNLALHGPRNANFNSQSLALVDEVFQKEHYGPIGYVPCRLAKDVPPEQKVRSGAGVVVKGDSSTPLGQVDRFDFGDLGRYEKMIVSAITWGGHSTYVLTGEMGSGKTATIGQVVEALGRPHRTTCGKCQKCDPVLINIDFNTGYRQTTLDDLLSKFRKRLYESFRARMRNVFLTNDLADKFRKGLSAKSRKGKSDGSWKGMSDGVRDLFDRLIERVPDLEWSKLPNAQRTRRIFAYIDEITNKGMRPFDAMLELVKFVRLNVLPDNPCFVLVFDNVDSIRPEFQYEILLEILAMQKICQLKALVAMRWATFERLNDQAAYVFGVIPHVGPGAKEIIHRRIEYFVTNMPAGAPGATDEPRNPVWMRLDYLHRTREDDFAIGEALSRRRFEQRVS